MSAQYSKETTRLCDGRESIHYGSFKVTGSCARKEGRYRLDFPSSAIS